jgi:hypothetical protein
LINSELSKQRIARDEKRPFEQIDRAIKNAVAEKKEENWLDRFMGTSFFLD